MTIKPISPQKCNAKWLNELVGHEPSYLPCISLVDHFKKKKKLVLCAHHCCVFPVFSKGASIQTMPCLGKLLKEVTECIIGKQKGYFLPINLFNLLRFLY